MTEQSQQSRQDERERSRSRSPARHQTGNTDPWFAPDQHPLSSVPQYMGTPEPMSRLDPNANLADQNVSPDPSEQSDLNAQTTPENSDQTSQSNDSPEPTDEQNNVGEGESSTEDPESAGDGSGSGGTHDEELQMSMPDDARQSTGDGESSAQETTQGEPSQPSRKKRTPLPRAVIARTGMIRAPRVPSPPAAALKRREEIKKRTGDTPEMHHAKIQTAVLRVVQAARDGQRQIVWRVENLSRDTRRGFNLIAEEIITFTGSCIARVRAAIAEARDDLTTSKEAQIEHMNEVGTLTGEELETSKTEAQQQMMQQLVERGTLLDNAHQELQTEFEPYVTEAQENIRNIEDNGAAFSVNPPEGTTLPASSGAPPNTSDVNNGPQQTLPDALESLQEEVNQKRSSNSLGAWHAHRIDPVLTARYQTTSGQLEESLDTQANRLNSLKAQFAQYAMRLSAPMARSFNERQQQAANRAEGQAHEDQQTVAATLDTHVETLTNKFDGVIAYLDEDLEPQLTGGLQKAGFKAAEAFRDQGKMSERMMNNTAATLALAYPELILRVAEMLPDDQFLNEREIGPRLAKAYESARRLPDRQYAQMLEQSELTLAQARESAQKQMNSIAETAQSSIGQVHDTVTATRFDLELFSFQVTGVQRQGSEAVIANSRDYALRMAEQILATRGTEDDRLAALICNFVGSLNQAVGSAGRGYFQAVEGFKDRMHDPNSGVFKQIEDECNELLSPKAQTLDEELTKPDDDVTTGLVVLNVATLGLTTSVTAGYLIYSDADDDEVFAAFSDLRWPAQPALKFYFESGQHANKGNLFQRFDECLSADAASRAKGLFSASATTRFNARRDSIRDSLTVFGLDADARRALTQGMDVTEREAAGRDAVALAEEINDSWATWFQRDTETRMDEGYLRGDMGMVLSARMEQDLITARGKSSDEIFQSVQRIEQMAREELQRGQSSLAVDKASIQNLTDEAIMDFAERRRRPSDGNDTLSQERARDIYLETALADRIVTHGQSAQTVPVDERVQDYARAVITGGWQSEDALAAKQAYELSRAEPGILGPSETETNRVTQAFVDQELAAAERELRENPDRADELRPRVEELRRRQEERMARVAKQLDPTLTDEDLERAGGATEYMAQRTARMFSGGENYTTGRPSGERRSHAQEDAQYGYELIRGGRASLTAGVRMATRGTGTNEDLLRMTFRNRSKQEVAQARTDWDNRYDENLDEYLGIQHRTPEEEARIAADPVYGWLQGGEISGDLANDIQVLARGNPESDQDYIELAALKYQQQRRRGTGGLGQLTMASTDEAQTIDSHYRDVGQMLLTEARRRRDLRMKDPSYNGEEIPLPTRPEDVFTHDGRINPLVAGLVFVPGPNRAGRATPPVFAGERSQILGMSREVTLAGDRYKSELDRQESLWLAGITALAIAATCILMAFGVGFILASVIVALGAGLMTMAVKSGMRGERYGWEEAAVDAASTVIEAAAAGVGGAVAKGMGPAARIAGPLARAGAALEKTFGRFGGMVVKEAIIGGVSMAGNTALQDETYKDGPGTAFGRIVLGGIKGGAISAVSGGISEGAGNRINSRLIRGLDDITDTSVLSGLGRGLGSKGRNVLKEGIAEGIGGLAGEATGIFIEVTSGTYRGGLTDALQRMGQAGLKDMVSAASRTGAQSIPRSQYNSLVAAARQSSELTDSDIQALRVAAKAAGESPPSAGDMRRQIDTDRQLLAQLPDEVRRFANAMDSASLKALVGYMQSGELAGASDLRRDMLAQIGEGSSGIPTTALLRAIEANSQRMQLDEVGDTDAQKALRQQMTANLPVAVRDVLQDIPLKGLERLPETELPKLAEAMARGRITQGAADSLLRSARTENPDLDAVTFLKNLYTAVQSARMAQGAHTRILEQKRATVLRDIPDADAALFARFPDEDLALVRSAMDLGTMPTSKRLNDLYQAALRIDPTVDRTDFETTLKRAIGMAQERALGKAQQQRQQREQTMENVPEAQRGVLSILNDADLLQLRLAQMDGEFSPALREHLVKRALKADANLDIKQFQQALDIAVMHQQPITRSADDTQALRNELVALAPPDQRHLLDKVPIVTMTDAEFKRFAQSESGNAVTIILNGEPVVVMRDSASPSVLREEGIHALQAQDPAWAKQIGSLDEGQLQRWTDLPVDVQVALYTNKLALEIDAHDRTVEMLGQRLRRSEDPDEQARLRTDLEVAQRTLTNLQNRMGEVSQLTPLARMQMQAGLIPRPQYLDQPARMFNKAEFDREAFIERALTGTREGSKIRNLALEALRALDDGGGTLKKLSQLDLTAGEIQRIVRFSEGEQTRTLINDLTEVRSQLKDHPETFRTIIVSVTRNAAEPAVVGGAIANMIRNGDDTVIARFVQAKLSDLHIHRVGKASADADQMATTLAQLVELSAQLPDGTGAATRRQLLEDLTSTTPAVDVIRNLHQTSAQFGDAVTRQTLWQSLMGDTSQAHEMSATLRDFVSQSVELRQKLVGSGIQADHLSQILRSGLEPADQIDRLNDLVALNSRLDPTFRAKILDDLGRRNDFVELVHQLKGTADLIQIKNNAVVTKITEAVSQLTQNHLQTAKNIHGFIELASPENRLAFAHHIDEMSAGKVVDFLNDFNAVTSRLESNDNLRLLANSVQQPDFDTMLRELHRLTTRERMTSLDINENIARLVINAVVRCSPEGAQKAKNITRFFEEATPALRQQFVSIGFTRDQVVKMLMASATGLQTQFQIQEFTRLAHALPEAERHTIINRLLDDPELPRLLPILRESGAYLKDADALARMADAILSMEGEKANFAGSIKRFIKANENETDTLRTFIDDMRTLDVEARKSRLNEINEEFGLTRLTFAKPDELELQAKLKKPPPLTGDTEAQLRKYLDLVYSNKNWKWDDIQANLSDSQRKMLRDAAKTRGLVPEIYVDAKTRYADFDQYAIHDLTLPRDMWQDADDKQFDYLDKLIGGKVPGYTWHHHEDEGRMLLVPLGLHKIYGHHGGRSEGHWGEGVRNEGTGTYNTGE